MWHSPGSSNPASLGLEKLLFRPSGLEVPMTKQLFVNQSSTVLLLSGGATLHPRSGAAAERSYPAEVSQLREMVMDREAWRAAIHGLQRVGHD